MKRMLDILKSTFKFGTPNYQSYITMENRRLSQFWHDTWCTLVISLSNMKSANYYLDLIYKRYRDTYR
eukprot:UN04411